MPRTTTLDPMVWAPREKVWFEIIEKTGLGRSWFLGSRWSFLNRLQSATNIWSTPEGYAIVTTSSSSRTP